MFQLPKETLVSNGAVSLIARRQGRLKEKDTVQQELLEKYGLEMCSSEESESAESEMEDESDDDGASESNVSDSDDSISDDSMSSGSETCQPTARQRKCPPSRKGRKPSKRAPVRRKPIASIMCL